MHKWYFNLATTFGLAIIIYIVTFVVVVISSAQGFSGGSPAWFSFVGWVLLALSGLITVWIIGLLITKISKKLR